MSQELARSLVTELKSIDLELSRKRKEMKAMNVRRKEIVSQLTDYLTKKDLPGFKYNGIAVVAETANKRKPMKRNEKIEHGRSVLEKHGIDDPEVINELIEAMRGDAINVTRLKIYEQN